MSDLLALVRFDDGEVRIAWYATDPEYVVPLLFDPVDAERLAAAAAGPKLAELAELAGASAPPTDDEPVVVWIPDHDRWWLGRASRTAALLTGGLGPFAFDDPRAEPHPERSTGTPAWAEPGWIAPEPVAVDPANPLDHPAASAPPAVAAATPTVTVPPALDDDAAFLAATDALLRGPLDGLAFERFLEGALARAGDDPEDLAHRLAPVLDDAAARAGSWDLAEGFVAAAVLELVGRPRNDDHLWFGRPMRAATATFVLEPRGSEVIERIRARRAGPLLSMPTEVSGAIDPSVLAERLATVDELDALAADLRVARSRAGEDEGTAWPAAPDWSDLATYRALPRQTATMSFAVLSRREMGMADALQLNLIAYPLVHPHHPERAVTRFAHLFRLDVDRGPSATPSSLAALCRWFATDGMPAGPAAGAVAAAALGAKLPAVVDAAHLVLAAHEHDLRWRTEWVPTALALATIADVVKLRRAAAGLGALTADHPALVRDVALGALPRLLDVGHRDAPLLMALAADGATSAGAVPAPTGLVQLAQETGSTKAHKEARRLLAVLDPPRA